LRWERELMGVYLSDHPMNALAPAMQPYVGTFVGDFSDESYRDETATLGAIVLSIRQMVTKKGASMAIVTVEDLTGSMEVVVFPQVWESTKSSWIEGEGILIAGRTEQRGEDWSVLVESVVPWEEASRLSADAVRSKLTVSSGGRRYAKRSVAPLPNGGIPAGMVPEGMETSAPLMPERAPAEFDAAVAVEALKIYEETDIVGHVKRVSPIFQSRLAALGAHPLVANTRGIGLIGALEIVQDKAMRKTFDPASGVVARLGAAVLEEGLITRALRDTMAVCPPLIITEAQIGELFDKLERALNTTLAFARDRKLVS
jgi:hypothetical protein